LLTVRSVRRRWVALLKVTVYVPLLPILDIGRDAVKGARALTCRVVC
jgi:hypothetical protein